MKKTLSILMIMVLAIGMLAGCSTSKETPEEIIMREEVENVSVVPETTGGSAITVEVEEEQTEETVKEYTNLQMGEDMGSWAFDNLSYAVVYGLGNDLISIDGLVVENILENEYLILMEDLEISTKLKNVSELDIKRIAELRYNYDEAQNEIWYTLDGSPAGLTESIRVNEILEDIKTMHPETELKKEKVQSNKQVDSYEDVIGLEYTMDGKEFEYSPIEGTINEGGFVVGGTDSQMKAITILRTEDRETFVLLLEKEIGRSGNSAIWQIQAVATLKANDSWIVSGSINTPTYKDASFVGAVLQNGEDDGYDYVTSGMVLDVDNMKFLPVSDEELKTIRFEREYP